MSQADRRSSDTGWKELDGDDPESREVPHVEERKERSEIEKTHPHTSGIEGDEARREAVQALNGVILEGESPQSETREAVIVAN